MDVPKSAGLAGPLCVLLLVLILIAPAAAQGRPEALTKPIQGQLDKKWPDWTLAEAPSCAETPVAVDINFDGADDLGLLIVPVDGAARLVVAMPQVIGGATLHDLGPLSDVPGATHFTVLPQGRPFRAPGAMLVDYLSGPTFAAASCGEPLVAFVWTGRGFRPVPLK